MNSNVKFLPGWTYTPTFEEKLHFDNLQREMEIFRAEIEYCYGHLADYENQKEMAHLRIRQVMGLVKKYRL